MKIVIHILKGISYGISRLVRIMILILAKMTEKVSWVFLIIFSTTSSRQGHLVEKTSSFKKKLYEW